MKKSIIVFAVLLSGCAMTHEQLVERAHSKSTAELCMALIQYPQLTDIIETELEQRRGTCDMQLAQAQVQAAAIASANRVAAMQTAVAMMQASAPHTIAPAPVVAPAPSGTILGFLQSQSTNGTLKYCKYSNGVVNTISSVELCPLNTQ